MTSLDPTVVVAGLALVGVLAGAGGTLIGAVLTRGTETRKLLIGAPTGYAQLVEDLQEERTGLRAEMARLIERDAHREQEMASMRTRLRGLEAGQDGDRRLIDGLRRYVVELRGTLRAAGVVPPPIPPGSGIEDSGPIPAVAEASP